MKQFREFAGRKSDFDALDTELVGISSDDLSGAAKVRNEVVHDNFVILSDPKVEVIRQYGLVHREGHDDQDISIRAAVLVDKNGREVFRRVSTNVADVPHPDEILQRIRQTQ